MKSALFALVTAFSTFSSLSHAALMNPIQFTKISQLTQINIDPRLQYAGKVESGELTVNTATRDAVLLLNIDSNRCPVGRMCPAMVMRPPVPPVVIHLPIVDIKVDQKCQVVTYRAARDRRPVDGNLEALEIVDNSKNTCVQPNHGRMFKTVITQKTVTAGMGGRVETFTSTMYGTELVQVIAPR